LTELQRPRPCWQPLRSGFSHEAHVPSPGSQYLNPKLSLVHPTFSLKRLVFIFFLTVAARRFPHWFLSWYFGSRLRLGLGLYGALCTEGALGKECPSWARSFGLDLGFGPGRVVHIITLLSSLAWFLSLTLCAFL
jgi:hypothetical protein